MTDPILWRDDGVLQSRLYGDVYFSREDGLAETEAVYLDGCGLPQAWAGRTRFTVAELGFGTGLNIAALLMRWRAHRPPGATLHLFSVEAHLMHAADAARALAAWPSIAPAAQALLAGWPPNLPGFHRLDLPGFDAVLDIALMDAAEALSAWDGKADAWLLDGFAPALNPAMWSPDLMRAVARHSAAGARAATFTVAGAVRRALAEAGFEVERRPGFGAKRQRLEARLPGQASPAAAPTVVVIGGGVAGASLMRALRAVGAAPRLFEAAAPGAGASGNPAALVTPAFDAGEGPRAWLYAQAHRRAVALFSSLPEAVLARGAVQREAAERDGPRFDKVAASPLFASLTRTADGLAIADGLVIDPASVLSAWIRDPAGPAVASLSRDADGWTLAGAQGADLGRFDAVVLAAGADAGRLWPAAPLQPVRGQASWAATAERVLPTAFGGYAIPTRDGVLFGATHDRDDADETVRAADHDRNRALLAKGLPALADRLADLPLEGRARRRAATPDRLPLAGAVPAAPGLFILGGLGSRGFCTAPLLAEHVASLVVAAPSPLPVSVAAIVDPGRPPLYRSSAKE